MHAVTFYSYKGGVGRSLLVANCAIYLAELGFKVVALDLDLEAPGLHYKFHEVMPDGFAPTRGIVDLIDDYITTNQLYESLADASFVVQLDDQMPDERAPRGSLRVIPAGSAPSVEYWRHVANIDWKRFLYDEDATGVEFFVDLRDRIAEEFAPDVLLIDSRTGITEIGNLATTVLADKVVCIVTDRPENMEGARAVLRGLRQHRRLSDEAPIEMMIAVSRPHTSLSISERLERIRDFLEEPADLLEATLKVGTPYPLTHEPELDQNERVVLGYGMSPGCQLAHDYMALAQDLVPEALWLKVRPASVLRGDSPFPYCVWSYSKLALEQPAVPIEALYRIGRRCFIVVPGFSSEMRASDGRFLSVWFDSRRVLGVPVEIVSQVPDGAIRVPDPSAEDLIELRDYPRASDGTEVELCLRLPRTFPVFRCARDRNPGIVVEVERDLLAGERTTLRQELASLGVRATQRLAIRVDASIGGKEPLIRYPYLEGPLALVPSRRLPRSYSTAVRELGARDEDVWISSRKKIYSGEISTPLSLLPATFRVKKARLFFDAIASLVPEAQHLIPFCDQLILEFPREEKSKGHLTAMGLARAMGLERESVIALAREGRLVFLLSHALDQYEPTLLNELAYQAPESLVFPRALCAATMVELRRRLYPWFFPDFGLRERYERLHRISTREGASPGLLELALPPGFAGFLSRVWANMEGRTHHLGVMALHSIGFGALLTEKVAQELKRDVHLESMTTGASIEQAGALGAVVVPQHRAEFSLLGLTKLGAAFLSLLSNGSQLAVPSIKFDVPTGKISARDLAALDNNRLQNVRKLISDLISGVVDNSSASQVISDCNSWLASSESPMSTGSKLAVTSSGEFKFQFLVSTLLRTLKGNSVRHLRDALAGGNTTSSTMSISDHVPSFPSIVVAELSRSTG